MRQILFGTAAMVVALAAGRAEAAFTITFSQIGNDVVAVGVGSITTSGLILHSSGNISLGVDPYTGFANTGPAGVIQGSLYSAYFSRPYRFGTANNIVSSTSGTGGIGGLSAQEGLLVVATDYMSGTPILGSSSTFANQTFASLGLVQGTYFISYSATQTSSTIDSFTIQVGPASVPEPTSLAMVGLGLAGLSVVARRQPA